MAELTAQPVNVVPCVTGEVVSVAASSPGVGERPPSGRCLLPPKLYRIGEVICHSGFSRQTIHNYTVMGLISECQWTPGGHRLYDAEVFERLAAIKALRSRHRLREIKRILDSGVDGS